MLLQQTPSRNLSEIINILNVWISGNPKISLAAYNTTLSISSDCDIEEIQGSECNPTPRPTPELSETPSAMIASSSESKGQAEAIAGGVLLVVAIITLVIAIVIIIVLVRLHVIKVGSLNM